MTKILQISDTHLFAAPGGRLKGVDVDAALAAVVADMAARHGDAELVLLTGDLVHEETATSYARLAEALAGLTAPVLCLPGNHEDKALLAEACAGTALGCAKRVFPGGWQVLLLDSARPPEPTGWLPPAELAFLEQSLAEHPQMPALVALHHPPLAVNSPWLDPMRVVNGAELLAAVARHRQVRAVVFGHIHQQFETVRDGTAFLGVPATCAQFRPGVAVSTADDRPPGYRWLRLGRDGALATGVERVAVPGSTSAPPSG